MAERQELTIPIITNPTIKGHVDLGPDRGDSVQWRGLIHIETIAGAGKTLGAVVASASDNARVTNATERTTKALVYAKVKEILIKAHIAEARVLFSLNNSAGTAYGRIYKNDVALGTEQSNDTTEYVAKTEDLGPFIPGDLLQVYAKITEEDPAATASVKDFKLAYDVVVDPVLDAVSQDPV